MAFKIARAMIFLKSGGRRFPVGSKKSGFLRQAAAPARIYLPRKVRGGGGKRPHQEMHSASSYFPAIATLLLDCGHLFYSSLSALSLCFPALQVGGIEFLLCPIDEQKVVMNLLLFHNPLSLLIWVRSARVRTSR